MRRKAFGILTIVIAALAVTTLALASGAGSIDTTYGSQGVWADSFPGEECPGFAVATGMAMLAGGSAIVVGRDNTVQLSPCGYPSYDFLVAKVTPTGTLDNHFGDDAKREQDRVDAHELR